MKKIGFIGLGATDANTATYIIRQGLLVWTARDLRHSPALRRFSQTGGRATSSTTEAARDAKLLVLMVHKATQAENILFGTQNALEVLRSGATTWLSSTVAPEVVRELNRLRERGFLLLDGPVSGGAVRAEVGTLTIMACGDPQASSVAKMSMQSYSSRIFNVGPQAALKVRALPAFLLWTTEALPRSQSRHTRHELAMHPRTIRTARAPRSISARISSMHVSVQAPGRHSSDGRASNL